MDISYFVFINTCYGCSNNDSGTYLYCICICIYVTYWDTTTYNVTLYSIRRSVEEEEKMSDELASIKVVTCQPT